MSCTKTKQQTLPWAIVRLKFGVKWLVITRYATKGEAERDLTALKPLLFPDLYNIVWMGDEP